MVSIKKRGSNFGFILFLVFVVIVLGLAVFFVFFRGGEDFVDVPTPTLEEVEVTTTTVVVGPDLSEEEKEAIKIVNSIDNDSEKEDCENAKLKEQCYLNLAITKQDRSLCEKIIYARYKTVCLEKVK